MSEILQEVLTKVSDWKKENGPITYQNLSACLEELDFPNSLEYYCAMDVALGYVEE